MLMALFSGDALVTSQRLRPKATLGGAVETSEPAYRYVHSPSAASPAHRETQTSLDIEDDIYIQISI